MANPTILQREIEEVAEWARHAYPTAGDSGAATCPTCAHRRPVRASRFKTQCEAGYDPFRHNEMGWDCPGHTADDCEDCRHHLLIGYIASGPFSGEGLWVCGIDRRGR